MLFEKELEMGISGNECEKEWESASNVKGES